MKVIRCELTKTDIGIFLDRAELHQHCKLGEGVAGENCNGCAGLSEDALPLAFIFLDAPGRGFGETLDSLLVHEIIHLCDFLFDYKGIETRHVNSEVKALFCDWAFRTIRPMLRMRRGKVEFVE